MLDPASKASKLSFTATEDNHVFNENNCEDLLLKQLYDGEKVTVVNQTGNDLQPSKSERLHDFQDGDF